MSSNFETKVWLTLPLMLLILQSGCAPSNNPIALTTATPTETPALATLYPISTPILPPPTPTIAATATDVVTAAPPSSTPSPTPTLVTSQGDRLIYSSQGDTIPLPVENTFALGNGINCRVISNSLKLREGPGVSYAQISTLAAGANISARKYFSGGEWLLVETTTQEFGWVSTALLDCQGDLTTLPLADGISSSTQPPPAPAIAAPPPALSPTPSPDNRASPQAPTATKLPPSTEVWQAEYYDNASLLGQPVLRREEPTLEFNWILDSPAPNLPADNFSARWTRVFDFVEDGDYRFFADADDGVRVYVDGWLVIDAWNTETPITHFGDFASIRQGPHTVVVEYFESGGHAHIKVWAEKVDLTQAGWRAEYYDNPDWRDPAVTLRQDSVVDFDWGNDAPLSGLPDDDFSIRWESTHYFDPGDYRFYAEVDDRDRVKVYLDGWLLIDEYVEENDTVEGFFANVGGGYHVVKVEYQDDGGSASIEVRWERES